MFEAAGLVALKVLVGVRGHSKSTFAVRRGEGRGYFKRVQKRTRGGESWKIVGAPIIILNYFKATFSFLFILVF